jgi:hypothetical protein
VGKGHNNILLERLLLHGLVILCARFIVLTSGALTEVERQLMRPFHRTFRNRTTVIPHPNHIRDHGPQIPKEEARRQLGIQTSAPVVAYLQGANQRDRSLQLADPLRRYGLLTIDRTSEGHQLKPNPAGWTYNGRAPDHAYGQLISASDAVLLVEDGAFASTTLHVATEMGRPLIGVPCPALTDLAAVGGAVEIPGELDPDSIATALMKLPTDDLDRNLTRFHEAHSDEVIAPLIKQAYCDAIASING